ncbi:dTDP-4-dehydrorhamnose reductase [Gymnodinialimonas hymeniacidonis]|uniref:dTDP-4-dehydrorhamnose reductase n=1 Tax=Gymnodinialimonas hymeniacidonis TaxID=3126508 RepID=UPI0034C6D67F
MKLLAFGQTGQVAQELTRLGVQTLGRAEADLTDPLKCAALIAATDADAVINAAAYTAVDKAEEEEATAHLVNAKAPAAMAQTCAAKNIPFVHISTDYVFDGSGEASWTPDAPTAPLGAYGRTKLAGEEAVRAAGGTHAIMRTAWVFSAHGANFVKTMLRLGAERDSLSIVADQIGGPTPARDIAAACVTMAEALVADPGKSGTYHFAGSPDASWADFAREIFDQADLQCAVTDIPSSAYPTPAERPKNSRLDCTSTEVVFGLQRPNWRAGLAEVLEHLHNS